MKTKKSLTLASQNKSKKVILFIAQAAIIAALYVALTHIVAAMGLASQAVQFRISEVLTVLPFFTPAAIPGLFIGCFLANFTTGCDWLDIIFGSLATLLAAILTYIIGKIIKGKTGVFIAAIPPIVVNLLIVPFIIKQAYGAEESIPFLMLTVGLGQFIICYILGTPLAVWIEKTQKIKHLIWPFTKNTKKM